MKPGLHHVVVVALLVGGVIHLLPLPGVLGSERLAALYGVAIDEPNLSLLMRHRAVLFGLLGAFMVWAAFHPPLHALALVAGLVSVVAFLWLAALASGLNERVGRVVIADLVALVLLLAGASAHWTRSTTH